MKKFLLILSVCLFNFFFLHAQGIYQLWGMTKDGGEDGIGTIFHTNASGNLFRNNHHFKITNQGANPTYTSLIEYNGKFYGMTSRGGNNGVGSGVIFEWDPLRNLYTKKIDLINPSGIASNGNIILKDGKFYGLTSYGGDYHKGVIFEWDPATNIYTKKIDFFDAIGSNPNGGLTQWGNKFYGMSSNGGSNGKGVIFEWDPSTNIYTKKIDLDETQGCNPNGNLTLKGTKFYGMTNNGGLNGKGVIFEWDPATNIYIKKVDLIGLNGSTPFGSLTLYGDIFYGMTTYGGNNDAGVIFEWEPTTNIYTKKIDLSNANGSLPYADLVRVGGNFYGMTSSGGDYDYGVIFEWNPQTNIYSKKKIFNSPISINSNNSDGYSPYGNLTLKEGKLYGMTFWGGSKNDGVVFEFDPSGSRYSKKIDLNSSINGQNPAGNLILCNGKTLGMTTGGGSNGTGVIFEWDPSGKTFTKKKEFDSMDGSFPNGSFTKYNGKLLGITELGGSNGLGVIFEWDPVSAIYTKKFDFTAANGSIPVGNLTFFNDKFYGMTTGGGANNLGVIFEWDPAINIYTKKIDFDGTNGSFPNGSLTLKDGLLYGMTKFGGSILQPGEPAGGGVIFVWDPLNNVFTKKFDFNNSSGNNPFGSLTLHEGVFYGTTNGLSGINGNTSKGSIFEWVPATNKFTKKYDFNEPDGYAPQGNLVFSNGKFYGLTNRGGVNYQGVIFEWDPVINIYKKTHDFDYQNGANPQNDLTLIPAPVARGEAGNCIGFPSVTIDNSNNNKWVPISDMQGDAVAEIKANGNNLGLISTSAFINNAMVREDIAKRLYLDRNLTFTSQVQPVSPVDIRLYIRNTEYLALKNAVNSIGQPSGINSINDVGIFKNNDLCSPAISGQFTPVISTVDGWLIDYVFTASTQSLSSFYFFNIASGGPVPLSLLEFNGRLIKGNGEIYWTTSNELNSRSFDLERSTDGRIFTPVANVSALNIPGDHKYNYTDKNISSLATAVIYYRLKLIDTDNRFTYSKTITLYPGKNIYVKLYPNPVVDKANIHITINQPDQIFARILDNTGKIIMIQSWKLPAGENLLSLDMNHLARGMYYMELKGNEIMEIRKFIK